MCVAVALPVDVRVKAQSELSSFGSSVIPLRSLIIVRGLILLSVSLKIVDSPIFLSFCHFISVCVCVRERKRESLCVCVCVTCIGEEDDHRRRPRAAARVQRLARKHTHRHTDTHKHTHARARTHTCTHRHTQAHTPALGKKLTIDVALVQLLGCSASCSAAIAVL